MSSAHESPRKRLSLSDDKISLIANAAGMALFAILACVVLIALNYDYLKKVEELSLFMSGAGWFAECMSQPGGLLRWCGTFLTQFFYHPWAGAAVMVLLLLGLWALVGRVFGLPRRLFALAGVPSVLLLLTALTPGYLIFIMKTPGFAYTGILGVACALALFGLYKDFSRPAARAVMLLVIGAAYPLLGFYALLAAGLCLLREIAAGRRWWLMLLALLVGAAVPQLYFYLADNHQMLSRIYVAGLPRYGADGAALWWPWVACFAFLALCAVAAPAMARAAKGKGALIASCTVLAASFAGLLLGSFCDENFRVYLRMDRAVAEGDYAAAVRASRSLTDEPTRVNGLYTHLALQRLGQAGDSLFTFRMSDAEYASPRADMTLRTTCSHSLNFAFGRINDCYRWCMEDMVEYGPKVEYLKYMSKCALLNGEYNLARRYLRMLSRTMFHKDWARRYMAYADNPEAMADDPELAQVRPLMAFDNYIGGDGALIETYLASSIAALAGGPPELVELSLQFNMVRKTIADFWPRFMLYARTHDSLPRHYQEAAILFSTLEGKVDWRSFKIDPDVVARFNAFMEMAAKNARYTQDTNREIFRPIFGDTYWFYYFFTTGLKTT